MKKIFNAVLALAMVITAGMSLSSCTSNDDNPTTPQNSLAQQLVGEWINEYDYDGTGDILIVTIYHFYGDGTCWKEINLRHGNEVVDIMVSRYATSQSTYTIDASGRVAMTVKNAETDTEETEVLTFDGTHLSVTYVEKPIIMVRATDAQIRFYQAEADAWHGGSDDGGEDAEDGGVAVGHPLSESAVGEIVGSDGLAYAKVYRSSLPEGVSAAAMVAYKDGTHGLAIALSDEPTKMNWDTAMGETGAKTHTPAVSGQTWRLPSIEEWLQMFKANGDWVNFEHDFGRFAKFNAALAAVGGNSSQLLPTDYWTSEEFYENPNIAFYINLDEVSLAGFSTKRKTRYDFAVRACFAF